jgi:hypothetical protein
VILAQVQDDRPLRVGQLGDVEGGRLLAMHAFHSASPQTIYRASWKLERFSHYTL